MALESTSRLHVTIITVALLLDPTCCARILGVFPCPSKSHLVVFTALTQELARRGHELVVASPFPLSNPPVNYTDIDLFPGMKQMYDEIMGAPLYDMVDTNKFFIPIMFFVEGLKFTEITLDNPQVKYLLKDKKGFDLVIVEDFMTESLFGFATYFHAPLILISSLGGLPNFHHKMGNPRELAYTPISEMSTTDQMTFMERLNQILFSIFWDVISYIYYMPRQERLRKKFFGKSTPSVWELEYSANFALINSHYSLNYPRPFVPAIQEVGGMQIKRDTQPLPQDIQTFLNNAREGAIYFSMGSNLRSDAMPKEKLEALLAAFAELPQRVLMKWESDSMPARPENVMTAKWFPQQDVLAHPNIRAFFTHGGLLSAQEAAYHGVPLVGVPIFGDQMMNMRRFEKDGFAVLLTLNNVTKTSVMWALNKVLHDPSIHREVKRRSRVFRDQPQTPLERAVYWTEYILRHKGADHLRTAALNLSWYQLHSLDVILVSFLVLLFIIFIFKFIFTLLCKRNNKKIQKKMKSKKNK